MNKKDPKGAFAQATGSGTEPADFGKFGDSSYDIADGTPLCNQCVEYAHQFSRFSRVVPVEVARRFEREMRWLRARVDELEAQNEKDEWTAITPGEVEREEEMEVREGRTKNRQ